MSNVIHRYIFKIFSFSNVLVTFEIFVMKNTKNNSCCVVFWKFLASFKKTRINFYRFFNIAKVNVFNYIVLRLTLNKS